MAHSVRRAVAAIIAVAATIAAAAVRRGETFADRDRSYVVLLRRLSIGTGAINGANASPLPRCYAPVLARSRRRDQWGKCFAPTALLCPGVGAVAPARVIAPVLARSRRRDRWGNCCAPTRRTTIADGWHHSSLVLGPSSRWPGFSNRL